MILEKFSMEDRTAVITGGARGIGAATAGALGEAGAHVVLTDIDAAAAEATVSALRADGLTAEAAHLDVTDSGAVNALADELNERLGGVDVLVNNAGIAESNVPAEKTSDRHWRRHFDINLDAVFWCARAFGKGMLARGRGSIVNIGSMSGIIANRPQPQSFYNASKAGVHMLTKSLAAEWAARGVRVNAVAPTYINTPLVKAVLAGDPEMTDVWLDMTPSHRIGEPEEVAAVVLFLACDASSLLTGSIVVADGGYTCW